MSRYTEPGIIEYQFVLVPGKRYARLALPEFLTSAEAARLVRFVNSLAVPDDFPFGKSRSEVVRDTLTERFDKTTEETE